MLFVCTDSSQDHPFTSRSAQHDINILISNNISFSVVLPAFTYTFCYRCRNILSHRFDLQSVYRHVLPDSGNAEVTTLHSQVGATVDYIFYSPKHTPNIKQQGMGNSQYVYSYLLSIYCSRVFVSFPQQRTP